jgi:hypothetical protein
MSHTAVRIAGSALLLALLGSPTWADEVEPAAPAPALEDARPTLRDRLRTPDREALLLDPRFDPIVLVRTSFVQTFEEQRVTTAGSETLTLDSSRQDPSLYGHRRGFVLEDAEFGAHGRFNKTGLYYQLKLELTPREKDGNRSSDYLEDAYLGWDALRVLDVRVGRMKVPLSQANLTPTGERLLPYSPNLDTLIPKRQLGVRISGGDPDGIFRLHAGVYNSARGVVEQIKEFKQLMWVGRVELRVHNLLHRLGVKAPGFEWQVAAHGALVKENFDPKTEHRWVGVDTRLRVWRFGVDAEWVKLDYRSGDVLPSGIEETRHGYGWHVDLLATILPGRLDVVGRVDQSDGDDLVRGFDTSFTIDDLSRQKKRWLWASARVHFLERAMCSASYIHRGELEGFSLKNDVLMAMCQYDL